MLLIVTGRNKSCIQTGCATVMSCTSAITPRTHSLSLPLQRVCVTNVLRLAHCCFSHIQRLLHSRLRSFYVGVPLKIPLEIKVFDVIIYEAFNSYLV